MEVTIRQLEYLLALAEQENFGRAAEQCFVTQPALSAQMAQLERTLGVQLVERGRKVSLTPAGEIVVTRARRILAELQDLRDAAAGFQSPLVGRIRLGILPAVAPHVLPPALPELRKRYPRLQLTVREASARELLAALHAGDLDAILTALGDDLGAVEEWVVLEDRYLLLAPEGHALAKRRRLTPADLIEHEVLLTEDGHGLHPQAVEALRLRGEEAGHDLRGASLQTLIGMVARGQGVTLVPELAIGAELHSASGMTLVRFDPPEPTRTLALVWRKSSLRMRDFRVLGQFLKESLAPRG